MAGCFFLALLLSTVASDETPAADSGSVDYQIPLRPPVPAGGPLPLCEEAPTEAAILRALPPTHQIPYFYEETRENVQIVTERLVDRIDPPRFFPLVGMAQLHRCHYKCTVTCTETTRSEYPFPFTMSRPRTEIVYLDSNYLHVSLHAESPPTEKLDAVATDEPAHEEEPVGVITPEVLQTVRERLVREYRKACARGDVERARKLGIEALAIDPTCLGKPLHAEEKP